MAVASVVDMNPSAEQRERTFFFLMAVLIALAVPTCFGLFWLAGISSFHSPWWVHVHGVSFMGWVALYLTQNWLIWRGETVTHRKLGYFGAGWAAWMVFVGLALTPMSLAAGRAPPFFAPSYFLALDWVNIAVFGVLAWAAIANRRRTDWHRRLMLSATLAVIGPAFGRMVVLATGGVTAPLNVIPLFALLAIALLADLRIRGRVHPAYGWGAAGLAAFAAGTELLAAFPPFVAFANGIAG
jgi:hypothetical protein